MKSKYKTSMVNGDIVLELEKEIKRLEKELEQHTKWQTDPSSCNAKDLYMCKIDDIKNGWVYVYNVEYCSDGVFREKYTNKIINPNYFKLLNKKSNC